MDDPLRSGAAVRQPLEQLKVSPWWYRGRPERQGNFEPALSY